MIQGYAHDFIKNSEDENIREQIRFIYHRCKKYQGNSRI
jgi:hypothetical protein